MGGPGRESSGLLPTLAALAALTCGCAAREGTRGISVAPVHGAVDVQADYAKSSGTDTDSQEVSTVTERVHVWTDGFVYHPNFMLWGLTGAIGLVEDHEWPEPAGWHTGVIGDYDARATFFRKLPVVVKGFGSRTQSTQALPFQGFVESETEQEGTTVDVTDPLLPASAKYFHEHSVLAWAGKKLRDEDTDQASARVRNQTGPLLTSLAYTFSDQRENLNGLELVSHNLSLSNVYKPADGVQLSSSGAYSKLSDALDLEQLSESETLSIVHGGGFETRWGYGLSHLETPGVASTGHAASMDLVHHLYESLTTALGPDFSYESTGDTSRTKYGGHWGTEYVKRVPFGLVSVGYKGSFARVEGHTSGGQQLVAGEPHTLDDTHVELLVNLFVDPSSVVVTNASSTAIYVQSADYELVPHGDALEIRRNPAGVIPLGATVLVDYRVNVAGDAAFDTLGNSVHARLQIGEYLSPYYRFSTTRSEQTEGAPTPLEQVDEHTAGVEAHWRFLQGRAEYLDHESNLAAYRSLLFEAGAGVAPLRELRLDLRGSDLTTWYAESTQRIDSAGLVALVTITRNVRFKADPSYRIERGPTGIREYYLITPELSAVYRAFVLSVRGGYQLGREFGSRTESEFISASLAREF